MKLKRGINFGGYLSQCKHSLAHYEAYISEADVQQVARWGFDHIRLPIDYEVLEDENGNEYPEGIAFVNRFVDWCGKAGLDVVLDLHKAPGYDFNNAGDAEKNNLFSNRALQDRFIRLWGRMAARYADRSHVAYELLNEVVEQDNAEGWNQLIAESVAEIRKFAPTTPIIYGGIQWNSARTLKLLRKPADPHTMFTFHLYEPMIFTHQKAHWDAKLKNASDVHYPNNIGYFRAEAAKVGFTGADPSLSDDKMGIDFIDEMVIEAVRAAKEAGVPLYCGEFGVIDQAPVPDTLAWFKDLREVFDRYDIHGAVWTYKLMDFGITQDHVASIVDELIPLLTDKK